MRSCDTPGRARGGRLTVVGVNVIWSLRASAWESAGGLYDDEAAEDADTEMPLEEDEMWDDLDVDEVDRLDEVEAVIDDRDATASMLGFGSEGARVGGSGRSTASSASASAFVGCIRRAARRSIKVGVSEGTYELEGQIVAPLMASSPRPSIRRAFARRK